MAQDTEQQHRQTTMTAELVAAYVAKNSVPAAELPNLIRSVFQSFAALGTPAHEEVAPELPKPAVSVKKSVTDEYIISLEDGRRFKSMKRYLSGLGMTPADYRAKWGLPVDYPMVAPAYAAKRSALAKTIGLGRKGIESTATAAPAPSAPAPAAEAEPPANDAGKKTRKRAVKAA